MTTYDKERVLRLDALPLEEKTEDIGIEFDVGEFKGLSYGEYPVVSIGWWFECVYVWYDRNVENPTYQNDINMSGTVPRSWERIQWSSDVADDGTIVVDSTTGAGIPDYEWAMDGDSPGAQNARVLYDALEDLGIEVN